MTSHKGYTLIEILIVIVIISIVSTVALLSIGHNKNRRIESLAKQLTQMLSLAEEQAMLQPVVLGVSINERTITFLSYQPTDNNKNMHWVPVDDKTLKQRSIPDGIQVDVSSSTSSTVIASERSERGNPGDGSTSEESTMQPQIVISPNGDVTPFTISIGQEGSAPLYVVKGEADGTISIQEQE